MHVAGYLVATKLLTREGADETETRFLLCHIRFWEGFKRSKYYWSRSCLSSQLSAWNNATPTGNFYNMLTNADYKESEKIWTLYFKFYRGESSVAAEFSETRVFPLERSNIIFFIRHWCVANCVQVHFGRNTFVRQGLLCFDDTYRLFLKGLIPDVLLQGNVSFSWPLSSACLCYVMW